MSRIGINPITIPGGVTVEIAPDSVSAKGKLGERAVALVPEITVEMENGRIVVKPSDDSRKARILWGTMRTQIQNLVTGVGQGFEKKLELVGTGYRAQLKGQNLELSLGFSHPVVYPQPDGLEFKVESPTLIVIRGNDKQQVGQVAAELRKFRPPEPYKGKGVRYQGEFILRKEGKKK